MTNSADKYDSIIRRAGTSDAKCLHTLYTRHLKQEKPYDFEKFTAMLQKLTQRYDYHILVAETNGFVAASVTLVVVDNVTHNVSPYALIENVVTHADHRGKGLATRLMRRACDVARDSGCYKVMLLTGSKKQSTLDFYRKCGFTDGDKTAFVMWL